MKRSLFLYIVIPLLATPLLLLLGLTLFQEKLLFYPAKLPSDFRFQFSHRAEEFRVRVGNEDIHSLFFPEPQSQQLLLYFHGNAGNLGDWGHVAAFLAQQLKTNVWIFDYPGFGLSTGKISSEDQLIRIGEAFADAIQKNGKFDSVVLYGRSIGSGIAAQVAGHWQGDRPRLAGLILETPYRSLDSLVHDYAPWFPRFLLKYHFKSDQALAQFSSPILILHGDADEIIPFHQGESLAETLSTHGSVTFTQIAGGHHNNLPDRPEYLQALLPWWRSLR